MKTEIIKINPEFPEAEKIFESAKVIRRGGLVVFPTETVYGVAADYNNPRAMARLREVKRRTENKPFSVLVSQKELIWNYTPAKNARIYKLIDEFWPGPLTIVVPTFQDGQTIGIRMPDNNIAIRLVGASQCTVAAPSANFEGGPPPRTCAEALRDLDGLVDLAIDGGQSYFGVASSVVDFTRSRPVLLRQGAIAQEEVDRVTERKTILFICTGNSCRSVMAQYLMKKMLAENGKGDIEVLSAGTSVFLHSSASDETVSILHKEGIDCSQHQATPMNNIMLHKADLILVMTHAHRNQVLSYAPDVEQRVYLLREFGNESIALGKELDIIDPMGKPKEAYEECLIVLRAALERLIKII